MEAHVSVAVALGELSPAQSCPVSPIVPPDQDQVTNG